jgi:FlaA1/EpsC-like NDP-sugar epimerase
MTGKSDAPLLDQRHGRPGAAPSRLAEAQADLPPQPGVSPVVITGLARLAEFLIVALTGAVLVKVYIPPDIVLGLAYWVAVPAVALVTVLAFESLGLYRISAFRLLLTHGFRMAGAYALVFLLLMAVVFFMKLEGVFSRVVFGGWFVIGLMALFAGRLGFGLLIRAMTRRGALDQRTAIVGGGEAAERLIEALAAEPDSDIRICGIFDERDDARSPDIISGYPKLGGGGRPHRLCPQLTARSRDLSPCR